MYSFILLLNYLISLFKLKLNSAPVFIHFPPKGKPKKGDQMDVSR